MKRGQITIFIILGMLLLIAGAVALFIFYSGDDLDDEFTRVLDTPFDIAPVYDYIDACVEDLAEDGMVSIGEHGGYAGFEYTNKDFAVDLLEPYKADAVTLGVDPNFAIPYWWYMDSDIDCISCHMSTAKRPSATEVFEGLDRYIYENLETCIRDFIPLKDIGYTFKRTGDTVISSYGSADSIVIDMDYPLNIYKDDKEMPLSKFQVKLDLDFISIFSLAEKISDGLISYQSMEKITMSLVGAFSGLDSAKLPPLAEITDSYSTVTWSKTITKFNLQSLLLQYIPFTQFNNTKGAARIDGGSDHYISGLFKTFYLDVVEEDFTEYNVRVLFLDWPIYLDITPSSGDMLKPNVYRESFPFNLAPDIQTNTYEFFYDITYPVIIMIEEPEALNGQGYRMMIAHEVNIRDNYNPKQWLDGNGTIGTWDYSNVDYDPDPSVSFASDDLFCNENQKIGSNIEVTVTDHDGTPIPGADIVYGCGTYQACIMAQTGTDGKFSDRYPICIGGYIKAQKEGYEAASAIANSVIDGQETVVLELAKTKHFEVEIKIKEITGAGIGPEKSVSTEDIFLTLTKKPDSADIFNQYSPQNIMISQSIMLNNGVDLSSGEYEVTAMLIDNEGFIIPAECEEICVGYDLLGDCDEYDYMPEDPIEMIPSVQGGLEIGEESSYWEVTSSDIEQFDKITFFVIKLREPTCLSDADGNIGLSELGLVINYTKDHFSQIRPKLSTS